MPWPRNSTFQRRRAMSEMLSRMTSSRLSVCSSGMSQRVILATSLQVVDSWHRKLCSTAAIAIAMHVLVPAVVLTVATAARQLGEAEDS